MEDTVTVLRRRTHRLHEQNTEPPEIASNNIRKIIDTLIKEKGVDENGRLEVNVLCVLGAGWDEVWREALENASRPGVKVVPKIRVFDYNESQIQEFGQGKDVVRMMIGDDADNDLLDELFEEGVDIFVPSNIPDWLEPKEVINLARLIKESSNPPLVISVAGKREYGGYGDFLDELDDMYKFDRFESKDPKYEVRYQAIGHIREDEEDY